MVEIGKRTRKILKKMHSFRDETGCGFSDDAAGRAYKTLHQNFTGFTYCVCALAALHCDMMVQIKLKITDEEHHPNLDAVKTAFVGLFGFGSDPPPSRLWGKRQQDEEMRWFAIRNGLVIWIAYWLGNYGNFFIFTPFNSYMAGTLSLLLNHTGESEFKIAMDRFLGLAVACIAPVLLMGIVAEAPWLFRASIHGVVVWLYFSVACYYYYATGTLIACFAAGFGCYNFMGTDVTTMYSGAVVMAYVVKLGNLSFLIALHTTVCWMDAKFRDRLPHNVCARKLRELLSGQGESDTAESGKILQCVRQVAKGDRDTVKDGLKKLVRESKEIMTELTFEVEQAKVEGIRGVIASLNSSEFPAQFYADVLAAVGKMVDQVEIITLVAADPPHLLRGASFRSEEHSESTNYVRIFQEEGGGVFEEQLAMLARHLNYIFIRVQRVVGGGDDASYPDINKNFSQVQDPKYVWSMRYNIVERVLENLQDAATELEKTVETCSNGPAGGNSLEKPLLSNE